MKISKFVGLVWLLIPPLMLSALVHMADPDIDGWQGLASYSVFWSILLLGLLAAGCVLFCFVVFVESGWCSFVGASCIFTMISGFLLAYFGSGATTALGIAWTFVGSSGLVFAFVFLAVVPAIAIGWPRSLGRPGNNGG